MKCFIYKNNKNILEVETDEIEDIRRFFFELISKEPGNEWRFERDYDSAKRYTTIVRNGEFIQPSGILSNPRGHTL